MLSRKNSAWSGPFRTVGAPVVHINRVDRADTTNLLNHALSDGADCGYRPDYGDQIGFGRVLDKRVWGAQSVSAKSKIPQHFGVTSPFFPVFNGARHVYSTLADDRLNGRSAVVVEDATITMPSPCVSDANLYLIRLLSGFTAMSADILAAIPNQNQNGAKS